MRTASAFLLGLIVAVALACAGCWLFLRSAAGFSAHAAPTHMEAMLAAHARDAAMPASDRNAKNPVTATPESLHDAMAHYADHCAVCHNNDGSGDTMMGNGMYPKPPDMRTAVTQGKTDGELFSIIQNGIRMSGMPAFGTSNPTDTQDSWKLVLFLRHLPQLTAEEKQQMADMNPKSPDEIQEEKQEADFLNGSDEPATEQHKRK